MPLPKLAVPEYDCTLPVSGQKVNFRPFLVKEEKLLYLAMESQKEKEMIKAVKTIVHQCYPKKLARPSNNTSFSTPVLGLVTMSV